MADDVGFLTFGQSDVSDLPESVVYDPARQFEPGGVGIASIASAVWDEFRRLYGDPLVLPPLESVRENYGNGGPGRATYSRMKLPSGWRKINWELRASPAGDVMSTRERIVIPAAVKLLRFARGYKMVHFAAHEEWPSSFTIIDRTTAVPASVVGPLRVCAFAGEGEAGYMFDMLGGSADPAAWAGRE